MNSPKIFPPGSLDADFNRWSAGSLVWLPQRGVGFYPVPDTGDVYDAKYFKRYQEMDRTEMGHALTDARLQLVKRHHDGFLIDVGIGGGMFVGRRPSTYGYDINPHAVDWLNQNAWYADPYAQKVPALSFWDSLEHIYDPGKILAQTTDWAFVSLPIFRDVEHILSSRHFRPDEHVWYFTHKGFIDWMGEKGFSLVEHNLCETELGRDGIGSYAFRRTCKLAA